jgi:nucleotide-binding universal stress UspA family protein
MYKHILLPVDLEAASSSAQALDAAVAQAQASGATLHVMTVVPDFGMSVVGSFFPDDFAEKALAETAKRLHAYVADNVPDEVTVQHIVAHGRIYDEIIKAAASTGAGLIVMSAHRPDVSDYLLGSNAARVARHAKQSVLIVR